MNSFRRVFLLAIAIALMSCAGASAGGRNVFRQRTVVRGGGGNVQVNAFAVQPFFVQPVQPVFVAPTAIYAVPAGVSSFRVRAFNSGCCGGGCW